MPRTIRNDKDVRSTSVIRGLRMERDLARRIRDHAHDQRLFRTQDDKGNVAACARHMLRLALGVTAQESVRREGEFRTIARERAAAYE